jgi:hypothetical protein
VPVKTPSNSDNPSRILILVPGEPELDPHTKRIAELCAKVGRTDILGFVLAADRPKKEYDGVLYTERIDTADYPVGNVVKEFISLLYLLLQPKLFGRSLYRIIRRVAYIRLRNLPWSYKLIIFFKGKETNWLHQNGPCTQKTSEHLVGKEKQAQRAKPSKSPVLSPAVLLPSAAKLRDKLQTLYFERRIADTLFERAKSCSIVPKMIICNDFCTLGAAVKLKELFGSPVIYDDCRLAHEPDPTASKWQKFGELMCRADFIITAQTSTAQYWEQLKGISHFQILCIPSDAHSIEYTNAIRTLFER